MDEVSQKLKYFCLSITILLKSQTVYTKRKHVSSAKKGVYECPILQLVRQKGVGFR